MKESFDQVISEYRKLASTELLLIERQPNNDIGAASGSEVNGWTRLSLAVDSGACATVANPELLPNYRVVETEGSRKAEHFTAASGDAIPNLGGGEIPIAT